MHFTGRVRKRGSSRGPNDRREARELNASHVQCLLALTLKPPTKTTVIAHVGVILGLRVQVPPQASARTLHSK